VLMLFTPSSWLGLTRVQLPRLSADVSV